MDLLYATDNQYIVRGFKETYLKGADTAMIDDWRSSNNPLSYQENKLSKKIKERETIV